MHARPQCLRILAVVALLCLSLESQGCGLPALAALRWLGRVATLPRAEANFVLRMRTQNLYSIDREIEELRTFRSPKTIAALENLLQSSSIEARWNAARLLVGLRGSSALPAMTGLLGTPELRYRALEFLLDRGEPIALPQLSACLRDSSATTRTTAIVAAGEMREASTLPILRELARGGVEGALVSLGKIGEPEDVELLLQRAQSGSPALRAAAVRGLGFAHATQAIPLLERLAAAERGDYDDPHTPSLGGVARAVLAHQFGDLTYHRLYRQGWWRHTFVNASSPVRVQPFPKKSHGQAFTLGGPLAGKAVLKTAERHRLALWRKALEAKDIWREAGFDYVPVEPLLTRADLVKRYHLDDRDAQTLSRAEHDLRRDLRNSDSDSEPVYSELVGTDVQTYTHMLDPSSWYFIERTMDRIKRTLRDRLGIEHGDGHPENFCVKLENGRLRVYVIDFDMARKSVR